MSATNTNPTSSSISSFCLKGLIEKDKLNGLNFRAIEEPHAKATQVVPDDFEKRRTESNEVTYLMLATMTPEL